MPTPRPTQGPGARVPAGEGFSSAQQHDLDRAIRAAEMVSRYEFSVYVGHADAEADLFARRLHAALTAPARSVLVMVDPNERILEVVTGSLVRRDLSDDAVNLAVIAMQSAFAEGDLVGGIKRGVTQLAEAAAKPRTLHGS